MTTIHNVVLQNCEAWQAPWAGLALTCVLQVIFCHLLRGGSIHDHAVSLLVIQMRFLIGLLIDHFQSDLTQGQDFRYPRSVEDSWDWERNRGEAGWAMKVWSQQLPALLRAVMPPSQHAQANRERVAAGGDELCEMWQGEVVGTMQKRAQQKCRKWRTQTRRKLVFINSSIHRTTCSFIQILTIWSAIRWMYFPAE